MIFLTMKHSIVKLRRKRASFAVRKDFARALARKAQLVAAGKHFLHNRKAFDAARLKKTVCHVDDFACNGRFKRQREPPFKINAYLF